MPDFKQFIYDIDGFVPPDTPTMGSWGFNLHLDPEIALRARTYKITDQFRKRAQEQARQIISGFNIGTYRLDDIGEIQNPYDFIEDSFLLRSIRVPGNACDLGLSESSKDDFTEFWQNTKKEGVGDIHRVTYSPHNVDTPMQAACLISLFSYWATTARVV